MCIRDSHMGKPKGKVKPELSLSQIVKNVSDALGVDVKFAKDPPRGPFYSPKAARSR